MDKKKLRNEYLKKYRERKRQEKKENAIKVLDKKNDCDEIITIEEREKIFQLWLKNHHITMHEFREKAVLYNEYHEIVRNNHFIFSIFEREITLSFMRWFLLFEVVMEEFVENQL